MNPLLVAAGVELVSPSAKRLLNGLVEALLGEPPAEPTDSDVLLEELIATSDELRVVTAERDALRAVNESLCEVLAEVRAVLVEMRDLIKGV